MPLTPNDFLKPLGLVEPRSMFPGETEDQVSERIQAYLDEAATKTGSLSGADLDTGTRAWVYYRAFTAVYIEMLGNPTSASMADQGSTVYSFAQIKEFDVIAKQYLAQFTALLNADVVTGAADVMRSASVPFRVKW